MSTFTSLNENVVLVSQAGIFFGFYFKPNVPPTCRSSSLLFQSLTVSEVQGLLGTNVAQLKAYENQTLVQRWIQLQPQSQLDSLGIGLSGGTTSPSATASATSATPHSNVTADPNTVTNPAADTAATMATAATTATTGESC